jgi:OOP family OmpA-OmpF porin
MKKFSSTLFAVSAVATLAACQGSSPPGYTDIFGKWGMQPGAARTIAEARAAGGSVQGGAYNQALYRETMRYAEFEFARMEDYRDSNFHANNAISAARGQAYQPTDLAQWQLPADKVGELTSARQRLVAALNGGAPARDPENSAIALAAFNCWVEQQEENFQPRDIAECRDRFYRALEAIEQRQAGFPEGLTLLADAFFDWSRDTLRPDALRALDPVAQMLVRDTSVRVFVWGFTDTSGPADYNQRLSERRAERVAAYLASRGVTRDRMTTQGFGEQRDKLRVQTPDGVRNQENRRVEIRRR